MADRYEIIAYDSVANLGDAAKRISLTEFAQETGLTARVVCPNGALEILMWYDPLTGRDIYQIRRMPSADKSGLVRHESGPLRNDSFVAAELAAEHR